MNDEARPGGDPWRELIDLEVLSGWMDAQGLESGPITDATQLTGGTQNILLCFRRGARKFVLRRAPRSPRMNGNETMRRESRMLVALANSDVPHPRLIAACGDESVLGGAFYLMEPVEGFNPTQGLPPLHANDPKVRWQMGIAIVDGIAALGNVDYRAIGLEGFGRPDNYLERQVSRWQRQLESYAEYTGWAGPGEIPAIERVARWLDDNRPHAFVPGIIHGDYHFGNVLYRYDGPELAAIVDWELTTVGDPLVDLGRLLSTWSDERGIRAGAGKSIEPWEGFPSAGELVARYAERSSRDLSAIDWYTVLSCYKIGIILEGSNARAAAGKAPRDIGDQLHAGAIDLFDRALSVIEKRS